MVPAFAAIRTTAARPKSRLGIGLRPARRDHGSVDADHRGCGFRALADSPAAAGVSAIVSSSLSGLDNKPALALQGEPAGGHGRIGAAFLTGVHAKPTEGADFRAGISIDQIAAAHLGQETQLASLELGLESTELSGACDAGFSCAYVNTLCWRSPTSPLPMESNPRAVFERLFGDSTSTEPRARLARMRRDRSILDSVTEKVADLKKTVGPADQLKLGDYLESVRDIERRIQKAEAQSARELPAFDAPSGSIPASFEEYAKLMFDLQVHGVPERLDARDHVHDREGAELADLPASSASPIRTIRCRIIRTTRPSSRSCTKVNVFHMELFAYYLEKLRTTPDGDGSLLDQMLLLYGSGMGNSDLHDPRDLPILVVGGGAGQIKGGRHLRYPKETPLTNLYMTVLNKVGVPVESVGDSTGRMTELSGIA